jgi:DNA-binding NtrC family response regulator
MTWRGAKAGVLIVDDEAAVLLTYEAVMKKQGYAVHTAISSALGKEKIDQYKFDLLLCDYSLEKQHTGFEVIDYAEEKQPGIKSIMLTGYATPETARQAEERGIAVLYKPIELPELFRLMESLLRAKHGEQASA